MAALDLAAIESATASGDPFDHIIVPGVIAGDALAAIHADFPKIDKPGSFPLSHTTYGPRFSALIDELCAPPFAERVGAKLGLDLRGLPTMVTARGRCRSTDGQIHTDSSGKVVTVLIYLNPPWEASGGRLRLLRDAADIDNYAVEVPPDEGTMVAFVCQPNAWHGHLPFEGERRAIQLNWVRSGTYKAREQIRHALSAIVKKLAG